MWYDNERVPEEEGVSKLLVGKTFAYFPKCRNDEIRHMQGEGRYGGVSAEGDVAYGGIDNRVDNMDTVENMNAAENEGITDTIEDVEDSNRGDDSMKEANGDNIHNIEGVDSVFFDQKEYVLIQQRLGRTIIPLNPELLAQSTMEQEIIDGYLSEIHKNVGKCSILTEYSFLMQEMPTGIYCLPQKDNLLVWDVFIILYSTVYKNGKFKAQIRLGENYPHTIPEIYFLSSVFHPFINFQTGKLNLGKHLNEWTPKCHYMSLIFLYMRNIFYLQDEYSKENIENEEAYFLLNNDRELFLRKVQDSVQMSNEKLYQQVDNYMFNFCADVDSREITDMMERVKNDSLCSKKAEAFIHWLVNDYAGGPSGEVLSEGLPSEEVLSDDLPSREVLSEGLPSDEILSENHPRDGVEEGGAPPNEAIPHYDNAKRENQNDGATPVDATAVQQLRKDRKKR
ncbi:ubiquitin-conjugating enzyme E2, putative [Plasmodium knowlesi strain H]|uniref:Ubiquitin-conjugating enzyme E2, putative n=3 Tax=Plasmodium knowlesi TaxID=5850 RepID=A0A5K1V7M0_PLAKH|nr:ubiquitin-conjugating enzyme E2, putative [Plasmodium knowlesi strain H]OTN64302.1 putative Ubiquitin-conjugating enzyme E2 [Plasmodium knowlesi]CAA9991227.1 ubiquitin-conjugating enzyme E2, putative [Plasmodium knowlesi strain H]SBO26298.1 ubiquitin-conjugating enzyme E2, putative [Plasmodium knowlesi strain H]SBO29572.1 ubiquitin-conjugating enzyme E2, putative [Plasmodium knowlesi strain H]VVS80701.1 ubiquitin-conjugating enzyme E2, putative [Plasmodium knowlesi strain H]|eukprot:XP_002262509.1 Ubiquitin-conjugating enzyme, putative [Plasmodium knowlesi strain H]